MSTPQRLTVLLPPADYLRLEDYCRENGFKKSTLVAKLVRDYLDGVGQPTQRGLFSELPYNEPRAESVRQASERQTSRQSRK